MVFCGPHHPLAFHFVCGPGGGGEANKLEGKWKVCFCLVALPQGAAGFSTNSSFCWRTTFRNNCAVWKSFLHTTVLWYFSKTWCQLFPKLQVRLANQRGPFLLRFGDFQAWLPRCFGSSVISRVAPRSWIIPQYSHAGTPFFDRKKKNEKNTWFCKTRWT